MSDAPPTIGPYEVLRQLGRGGMGVVYRARHRELGREVALKVIAQDMAGSSSAAGLLGSTEGAAALSERFRREAQSAGRLAGHPHIVAVHDVGEFVEGEFTRLYLAMDLVEGHSLEELIDEGELTLQDGARLIAETARGAHHAHEAGVLHRDIKPGNILVGTDGAARLTDFGLARPTRADPEITRLTQAGEMLGTPAYMAPEQARGAGLDARADVYSLGATLYDVLCGRPPFAGDSTFKVLSGLMRERPAPPSAHRAGVPRDLDTIVLACLEKDPADRYPTAAALADDLEAFCAGRPISRRAPGAGAHLTRLIREHPIRLSLTAVIVGCAVAGGWIWHRSRRADAAGETKLAAARESVSAAERAAAAADRLYAVARTTRGPLRTLEDYANGADISDEAGEAAVAEFEGMLTGLPPALVAGWRAVAWQFLGKPKRAWPLVAEAVHTQDEDPFPKLLAARAALGRYVRLAERPKVGYAKRLTVADFEQSDTMRLILQRVDEALEGAEASPLWPHIRQGGEYRDYVVAAQSFGRGEFAEAAAKLDGLADDDALGGEAALLAGLAWYVARNYPKAAASWERAGARGWPNALRYAADAWDAHATVLLSRGEDPRPALERAEPFLARAATSSPKPTPFLVLQGNLRQRRARLTHERGGDALALLPGVMDVFTKVVELGGADVRAAYNNRGNTHLFAGRVLSSRGIDPMPRWRMAEADYERALKAGDDDPWPLGHRAGLYHAVAMYHEATGGDPAPWYERCIADCNAVLAVYPQRWRIRMVRAAALSPLSELLQKRGDAAGAQRSIAVAVEDTRASAAARPEDFEAHLALGAALRRLARFRSEAGADVAALFDEAFAAFAKADALRPGSFNVQLHTAQTHRVYAGTLPPKSDAALKQCDAAIAMARKAIACNETLATGWVELLWDHTLRIELLIARRGDVNPDWQAMQRTFPKIDQLAPAPGREILEIARACEEIAERGAKAGLPPDQFLTAGAKAATIVTERAPDWSRGWSKRALFHQRLGQRAERTKQPEAVEWHRKAVADFTQSLKLEPDRFAMWNNRANSRRSLAKLARTAGEDPVPHWEAAVQDYSQAIKLRPTLWQAWLARGATHNDLGRRDQAIADLQEAQRLNPNYPVIGELLKEWGAK
ncbi:MAG: protein kinase domain-containing protein [Planctomycetota bacterium]